MNGKAEKDDFESDSNTYAIDRTVLANERTFAAWIRTGLAALAAGLAIEKFMIGVIPAWSHQAIAAVLLIFSLAAFLVAGWRYTHVHLRMAHLDVEAMPRSMAILISLGLAGCSLIAVFIVLLADWL
ncbi:MAG TPA: DUF202 domain-containing protein [Rhizobiales bacterium]|nr:hypothetical protein BMS3Bbin10_02800 [bacterium BMS3Bbin10]HDO52201.1 DUF202 domain-containing protein [Hyphomicrobiales bacterium]